MTTEESLRIQPRMTPGAMMLMLRESVMSSTLKDLTLSPRNTEAQWMKQTLELLPAPSTASPTDFAAARAISMLVRSKECVRTLGTAQEDREMLCTSHPC
eukprot:762688-Hanusia_phi.AAC.3